MFELNKGINIVVVETSRELSYPLNIKLPYEDSLTNPRTDELTWHLRIDA